ncbi:MAG: homoserine kinase [Candidatus Methanomethyliaceae archaeon]|nr:homoserine kinase [Candidatus Methanomethyliaceae archaeon]
MVSKVRVSAPATIANLGPGFDIIGMALNNPRDFLEGCLGEDGRDELEIQGIGANTISKDPKRNSAMVAGRAVLEKAGGEKFSIKMRIVKGVPPRIGLGSSGASSAAGAYAVNYLLGMPLNMEELLQCAMEGEKVACGSPHADNVAPALFGGIVLILSFNPIRIIRLEPITNAEIVVITPKLEIGDEKTKIARKILPKNIPLQTMVNQVQSFANLIIGLVRKDLRTIGIGISGDFVIEPARSKFIPKFYDLKEKALELGAYGFSISGAGPSMFALCKEGTGDYIGKTLISILKDAGTEANYSLHTNSKDGVIIVP